MGMIDKDKVLIGLGQHISGRTPERCGTCPYFNGDSGYGVSCRDELLDDLYEILEAHEPHILTMEQASGRDYCFYEYRATGYVEPASVVISGMMLGGAVPLAEVYRLGREGAACVAICEYGRTWRCWDRMPEDWEKEAEPWES